MGARFYRAARPDTKSSFWHAGPGQTCLQSNSNGGSGGARPLRHAVQHDVLLAEFEPGLGPGADVVPQHLRALLPVVAVHATIGLWGSAFVAHGIEPQAIEAVALDQFTKCVE